MTNHGQRETLPPHSDEAEAGVLGCCLLAPGQAVATALERLADHPESFYDLRHRAIWLAVVTLHRKGRAIDTVTLAEQLRADNQLDSVGGTAYLAALPDQAPMADNIQEYLQIVWEKFLARQLLARHSETSSLVLARGGLDEVLVARVERSFAEWKHLNEQGEIKPRRLAEPSEFDESFFNLWYKRNAVIFGWDLHIPLADLRVRPHELTTFTAENGAGKSTHLCQLAVALGAQGVKVCIASMEVPAPNTLWTLSRQLIGAKSAYMADTEGNQRLLNRALAWMQTRFRFYNFLGITSWRDVLDTFRYAREKLGWQVFILDSVLKIGIPDDDYAQQTTAANAFADFCLHTGASLYLVVHQNKGEGSAKKRVRGAAAWTDVADVVLSVRRNESKDEKLESLERDRRQCERLLDDPRVAPEARAVAETDLKELATRELALRKEWDSEIRMHKQRFQGALWQNGCRRIWFHRPSLQFQLQPGAEPHCYLDDGQPNAEELDLAERSA